MLPSFTLKRVHRSRLMQIWRSAGWRVRDAIEIDLLSANLIAITVSSAGHETLCLTDAGVRELIAARERGRCNASAHDLLAERVAQHLTDSGRIVWRELSLRAQFITGDVVEGAGK